MKEAILKAIDNTIEELDNASVNPVIEFLGYLDKVELYTFCSVPTIDKIYDFIYENKLQHIVYDLLTLFSTNLELNGVGASTYIDMVKNSTNILISSDIRSSELKDAISPIKVDATIAMLFILKTNIKRVLVFMLKHYNKNTKGTHEKE